MYKSVLSPVLNTIKQVENSGLELDVKRCFLLPEHTKKQSTPLPTSCLA